MVLFSTVPHVNIRTDLSTADHYTIYTLKIYPSPVTHSVRNNPYYSQALPLKKVNTFKKPDLFTQ